MGDILRIKATDNQQITAADHEFAQAQGFLNYGEMMKRFLYAKDVVVGSVGLDITAVAGTMQTRINTGNAIQGFSNNGKFIVVDVVIDQTHAPSNPTNPRIDTVQIQFLDLAQTPQSRNFIDQVTGQVDQQTINTRGKISVVASILAGTPAGSPVAPAVTAGYLKLAEVRVPAAAVDSVTFTIKDVDLSSTWTTEISQTTRIPLLTDAPSSNEVFYEAGEAFSQYVPVFKNGTTDRVIRANATSIATMPALGLSTVASTGAGDIVPVIRQGVVKNGAWTWTVGGIVYINTTVGTLTQTAPTVAGQVIQAVGIAKSATEIDFNFDQTYTVV